jgi:hypothetical protein
MKQNFFIGVEDYKILHLSLSEGEIKVQADLRREGEVKSQQMCTSNHLEVFVENEKRSKVQ